MSASLFDLTGKVALVTGSSVKAGIGHAIAIGYAEQGADVIITDIDDEGIRAAGEKIKALGRNTLGVRCDITKPEEIEHLFGEIDKHFGKLDILVNVPHFHPGRIRPHELNLELWQKTFDVGATGYFLCSQQAIRRMINQENGGSILNIGSVAGVSAMGRGNFAYSCAKGAVSQMTKELAVEYAHRNIRVNCILPAQVNTLAVQSLFEHPLFKDTVVPHILKGIPLGRIMETADMVGPAIFLVSDAASAVTGVLLPVDGGNLALNAAGMHTWPDEG